MSAKKRGSRSIKPVKMSMFVTRALFFFITLAFAAFTVINYGLTLWEDSKYMAVFLMAVFGLSAMATPFLTPMLVHARGVWIAIGVFCLAVFMAIDALGFSAAFKGQVLEPQLARSVTAWEASNKGALERLQSARDARDAVSMTERSCLCPETRRTDLAQYEAKVKIADEAIEKAESKLTPKPAMGDIVNMDYVTVMSALIQIVLALVFAFIEAVREGKFKRDMSAHNARYTRKKEPDTKPIPREEFGGLFAIEGGKA